MKNLLSLTLSFALAFSLIGCSNGNTKDNRTLSDFKDAFTEAGYTITGEDIPTYSLIGADDAILFYASNQVVKIYQYKDDASYKKALESYSLVGEMAKNGLFLAESSSDEMLEYFKSISISPPYAPTSTGTPTTNPTPTPTPEPTPEPASETVLSIGETGQLGDWEITLDSFDVTTSISSGAYSSFKADEGDHFVVVYLTIKNTGKTSDTFLPSFSSNDDIRSIILYQGEYEFSASNLLGSSEDLHNASVNPLSSKTGIIAFSVVDEAALSDELTLVLSLGRESLEYSLI